MHVVTSRIGAILLTVCSLYLPSLGHSQSISCASRPEAFAAQLESMNVERKLSPKEFHGLEIQPSGAMVLKKGTELNVLVDVGCMKDPTKGPQRLNWLKDLLSQIHDGASWRDHRSFQWKLEKNWDFHELQADFEEEPCVDLVSPDGEFKTFARISDPFAKEQVHLDAVRFSKGLNDFLIPMLVRPKIVIAVIDTGVDFDHEDLKNNRWRNPREVAGNNRDDDRNGYVDDYDGFNFSNRSSHTGPEGDWPENRHGTHVAGLAAGRIDNRAGGVGIAGLAKVMSLNVFGDNGVTRSSILENAIRYAADHDADVINMSLGGREYSRTMRAALSYAVRKGSFIVAASGNEGVEICDEPTSDSFISPAIYGSALKGMISVSSMDTLHNSFSLFSNYSPRLVEIAAPGAYTSVGRLVGLLSSIPNDKYGYLAGTSMAAPVVSGAAALVATWLKAYDYSVSPGKIESILKAAAKKSPRLIHVVESGRTFDLKTLAAYLKENYPAR